MAAGAGRGVRQSGCSPATGDAAGCRLWPRGSSGAVLLLARLFVCCSGLAKTNPLTWVLPHNCRYPPLRGAEEVSNIGESPATASIRREFHDGNPPLPTQTHRRCCCCFVPCRSLLTLPSAAAPATASSCTESGCGGTTLRATTVGHGWGHIPVDGSHRWLSISALAGDWQIMIGMVGAVRVFSMHVKTM
jgi:hypothetical protein